MFASILDMEKTIRAHVFFQNCAKDRITHINFSVTVKRLRDNYISASLDYTNTNINVLWFNITYQSV